MDIIIFQNTHAYDIGLYSVLATRNPCYVPSMLRHPDLAAQTMQYRDVQVCDGQTVLRSSVDVPQCTQ